MLSPTEKPDRSRSTYLLFGACRFVVSLLHGPTATDVLEAFFDFSPKYWAVREQGVLDIVFCHRYQHGSRTSMGGDKDSVSSFNGPEHLGCLGFEFANICEFHRTIFL